MRTESELDELAQRICSVLHGESLLDATSVMAGMIIYSINSMPCTMATKIIIRNKIFDLITKGTCRDHKKPDIQ